MSCGFKDFIVPDGTISFPANSYQSTKTVTINGSGAILVTSNSHSSLYLNKINIDGKYALPSFSQNTLIYFTESVILTFWSGTDSSTTVNLSNFLVYYLY